MYICRSVKSSLILQIISTSWLLNFWWLEQNTREDFYIKNLYFTPLYICNTKVVTLTQRVESNTKVVTQWSVLDINTLFFRAWRGHPRGAGPQNSSPVSGLRVTLSSGSEKRAHCGSNCESSSEPKVWSLPRGGWVLHFILHFSPRRRASQEVPTLWKSKANKPSHCEAEGGSGKPPKSKCVSGASMGRGGETPKSVEHYFPFRPFDAPHTSCPRLSVGFRGVRVSLHSIYSAARLTCTAPPGTRTGVIPPRPITESQNARMAPGGIQTHDACMEKQARALLVSGGDGGRGRLCVCRDSAVSSLWSCHLAPAVYPQSLSPICKKCFQLEFSFGAPCQSVSGEGYLELACRPRSRDANTHAA